MADLESTSSVVENSSYNSFEVCDFLDGIMSYLEDLPVSSSSSLEGVSVTPSSVIEQLSSEVFQKKATNKVRKILIKSVTLPQRSRFKPERFSYVASIIHHFLKAYRFSC